MTDGQERTRMEHTHSHTDRNSPHGQVQEHKQSSTTHRTFRSFSPTCTTRIIDVNVAAAAAAATVELVSVVLSLSLDCMHVCQRLQLQFFHNSSMSSVAVRRLLATTSQQARKNHKETRKNARTTCVSLFNTHAHTHTHTHQGQRSNQSMSK